jgi:dienelactone hydrolase
MLGLSPLPEKADLHAQVTGTAEKDGVVVERLHFQSLPGLYVTGNLYRPAHVAERLPAVLYVCGHGRVVQNGVSYGNKVHYQHHGGWLARNGYVCLTIDTLQLGEIEGEHHGTYRLDKWWWINRGYTPAGVEAWNCVRALDYLASRPEVDANRLGVTGRSGGGAYSWWIGAIDDRVKVAVPVAGITDLRNHVVDGCVEGHCDCMYLVNTYRWDYPQVAALMVPRPLLISNTDRDSIFPVDGVYRTYRQVRRIYELYDAGDNVALHVTAGPHKDTQELRVHAFRWLNHYLRDDDSLVRSQAEPLFELDQLKVLDRIPENQRNTRIDQEFVPLAEPPQEVADQQQWQALRSQWHDQLRWKVFGGWPEFSEPLDVQQEGVASQGELEFATYIFTSQNPYRLPLYVVRSTQGEPSRIVVRILGEDDWPRFASTYRWALPGAELLDASGATAAGDFTPERDEIRIYVAPRGVGTTAWTEEPRQRIHIARRFYLLGQTLDAMRIWDVRRAVQSVGEIAHLPPRPVWLSGQGVNAALALYAALFEWNVDGVELVELPVTHRNGPYLLNVRRFVDMPQVVAMAASRIPVVITTGDKNAWQFPRQVQKRLGIDHLKIKPASAASP